MKQMKITRRARTWLRGFALAAFVAAGLMLAAGAASADKTFTVTTVGDGADSSLSDGVCDTSATAGLQCTLRAAIQNANISLGADAITFNIPGEGVKSIFPTTDLPRITEAVTIDGYTQPGAAENTLTRPGRTNARPLVQINGAFMEGDGFTEDGLDIAASGVVVRGLVIDRFARDGLDVTGRITGLVLEGNFIGVDASGTEDFGNEGTGVHVFNTSGNHRIGGTSPAARNVISGNDAHGVVLLSENAASKVEGNIIGAGATGREDLGNTHSGVFVGSSGVTVGGTDPRAANLIAFNTDGVSVSEPNANNQIIGNSIFANDRQGIGLGLFDGPTTNDTGDTDTGANNLQNHPVLTSARIRDGKTTIRGKLNSRPGQLFRVQIFSSPPGGDEGKTLIGQRAATTNLNGNASFSLKAKVGRGRNVTATATDLEGNTSEFSAPRKVTRR